MSETPQLPADRLAFFERFDDVPFHRYLGLTLAEWRLDEARLRLTLTDQTPTGIGGSVNGGVIATLVDMAVIPAVFSGLREGSQPAGTATRPAKVSASSASAAQMPRQSVKAHFQSGSRSPLPE